jgi:hypothetical protein
MTEKELKEAPETADELADTEIEDATGGVVSKPGTLYDTRPGVKFE